jgi:hypothetical protein
MIKPLLVFLFVLLLSTQGFSQLEKGKQLAGVQLTIVPGDMYSAGLSMRFGSNNNAFAVSLVPTYGYAVARNWLIGGTVTLGYSRDHSYDGINNYTYNSYDIGFAPYTRLYLDLSKNGQFKIFGLGSVEFATIKSNDKYNNNTTFKNTYNTTTATIGVGLAYFMRRSSIDLNVSGAGLRFGVYRTF